MAKPSDHDDVAMWDAWNKFHYLCDTHRFQKIFARADLVRMIAEVPGDIVDAGAFKGTSTLQFAHLLETYQPNSRSKVVAFDTFDAVFPKVRDDEAAAAEAHMRDYDASAFVQLSEAIERLGLRNRIEIVQGDIAETLPNYIQASPGFRISLLHCDLDVYAATLATLEAAWPRLTPGGIAVFDEYAIGEWGESDAVDAFLGSLAEPPELKILASSPTPTAYCVKGPGRSGAQE
ncbi:MAG: class I SAM-dependent methyltransferase [Alphaproteobacteria bacterium]|nr:class I SAM-dependent methyltransferase [Alphaproteobacteria bacterium]